MNTVERFEKVMRFEPVDRLPMMEWAFYWNETTDRWYKEGLPRDVQPHRDICVYLGMDSYRQLWVPLRTENCPVPPHHGAALIHNTEDYEKFLPHLFPSKPYDVEMLEAWDAERKAGDTAIWLTFEGFFWFPRTLFGIEQHMYAFYDHAELMHRMNQDLLQWQLRMLDDICQYCQPQFMTFAEDMSYNHGPMLSNQAFDEFLAPYYRQIIPKIKKKGIRVFVDSDGDVSPLIPWLKEVGVEGILPLERMAGVDVAQLRKAHPEFLMIGAFDKTIMHLGQAAMRAEFERLLPVMKQGGFIPSVDHQTPPDVSLEAYRCYVSLLKEYTIKAG